jgi:hypothetical protein
MREFTRAPYIQHGMLLSQEEKLRYVEFSDRHGKLGEN